MCFFSVLSFQFLVCEFFHKNFAEMSEGYFGVPLIVLLGIAAAGLLLVLLVLVFVGLS